ncbi:hypothetical protein [Allostreptomyces psammosilenae]|uniref:PH domain-containing protein n=1 Tax=Allostreptomyces psammosilenae TaxID=1892865 RepID=A0A853A202_9ACTN|nr:hypothetical protein [Allostreptomyces psammosilenae]NYI08465.1 hypothetical protein [Allostreptomyces psammosilenae]
MVSLLPPAPQRTLLHDQWNRPYAPGPWRVGGAAFLGVLASYLLVAGFTLGMVGSGPVLPLVLAVLLLAAGLRLLRVGVWVSRAGVRSVALLRTTTVRWTDLVDVRVEDASVPLLGLPRRVRGQALVLVHRSGRRTITVLTDQGADFLRRADAFADAADVLCERAAAGLGHAP